MAWQVEDIRIAEVDTPFMVGGFELELKGVDRVQGPNYLSTMGRVILRKDGTEIAVLNPEKHSYIYFVADPSKPGYHMFAKNLIEHNRNKKIYVNWINQKKIFR
jgi:cytochrome c biogenesis factor